MESASASQSSCSHSRYCHVSRCTKYDCGAIPGARLYVLVRRETRAGNSGKSSPPGLYGWRIGVIRITSTGRMAPR
jgi:hypothetical protein